MRKKSTVIGLYLSVFVFLMSIALAIYSYFESRENFNEGIMALIAVTGLLLFVNWINYSKFKKEEKEGKI